MDSVSSAQKDKYQVDAFFAGVGGIELGFKQTGKFRVIYANEFDKNARITYRLNNPDIDLDGDDIHKVIPENIPDCDVIMGGFPCQAFSIAGYRKGFEDDRGDLFFELLKMIKAKQPKAIFIENVKNMVTHDHGNTFKIIREALVVNGYYIKWKVLNGKDYGNIPQNRERIYIVGFKSKEQLDDFEFPEEKKLTKTLRDIIDFSAVVDDKYYYEEGRQNFYDELEKSITSQETVYQWRRQYVRENKSGVVPTLTANMGTGGHNVPLILTDDHRIRKLTPKETFNAQGYPEDFKLPANVSNGQLYKQAGNSVVVPVIKRIAKRIATALDRHPETQDVDDGIEDLTLDLGRGSYALIYININGRYDGYSYVEEYFDTKAEIVDYIDDRRLKILSDDKYLKLVQNGKSDSFYMIEKI